MHDAAEVQALKLAIYWAAWLYFLAAPVLALLIVRRTGFERWVSGLVLASLTVLAYARFVEPRLLTVKEHALSLDRCFAEGGALRLAVISDTHIGIFGNAMPIERIMRRVAAAKPDAVLVAGDLTYYLDPKRFNERFRAFGTVGIPVYSVLGNHDVGFPGPDVGAPLAVALERLGVRVIDNRSAVLRGRTGAAELVGLSDLWQNKQDLSLVADQSDAPRLVLTHNPRTIALVPYSDLLIAGHTHGGQIYIPLFTCAVAGDACEPLRYGAGSVDGRALFVTSGTGMIGLPMRFMVPPRIDILNVSWAQCL